MTMKVFENPDGWMVDSNLESYGEAKGMSVMLYIAGRMICMTSEDARDLAAALVKHADETKPKAVTVVDDYR